MSATPRRTRARCAAFTVALLGFADVSLAVDRWWVGGLVGNWNNPNNWSPVPGGFGGFGPPVAGDVAHIHTGVSSTVAVDAVTDAPGVGVDLFTDGTQAPFDTTLTLHQSVPTSRLVVAGNLALHAGNSSSRTFYVLDDGTLEVGGMLSTPYPEISRSRFTINGGTLLTARESLTGEFTQTGGHHVVTGTMSIGGTFTSQPRITHELSGGTLDAGVIDVNVAHARFSGAAVTADTVRVTWPTSHPLTLVAVSAGSVAAGRFELVSGELGVSGGSLSANEYRQTGGTAGFGGTGAMSVGTFGMTGGSFRITPGAARVLRAQALDITGGTLDLTDDNGVHVDYTGANPIHSVRGLIAAGRITATDANGMGVAYAQAGAITAVPAMFGTVDVDSVLILPRLFGDANWDGIVNLADFNRLAANFGLTNKVWTDGDFNYDGTINLADFNRLAANFGMSATSATVTPQDWANLAAAIPEPASALAVGSLAVIGATSMRRRRGL